MRKLSDDESPIVAAGEVGATTMGDNVSYTGVYPACELAGQVAEAFTMGLAELTSRVGGVISDGLDLPGKVADRVIHECIRTHGDSSPSIPDSAGVGTGGLVMMIDGDFFIARVYGK